MYFLRVLALGTKQVLGMHREPEEHSGDKNALGGSMVEAHHYRTSGWQPAVLEAGNLQASMYCWIYFYLRKVQVHHYRTSSQELHYVIPYAD